MHIHGHNFWVVAEGKGEWNGTVTRPANPQRRDTQIIDQGYPVPAGITYVVVEFVADNPGVWPFHCHVAWHVSDGLYINIVVCAPSHNAVSVTKSDLQQERPNDIKQHKIPSIMAQTCRDWATFSGHDVVNQIDSGL
jgi:hypothetical protein